MIKQTIYWYHYIGKFKKLLCQTEKIIDLSRVYCDPVYSTSLVNYKDGHLYLIGGTVEAHSPHSLPNVFRYTISGGYWSAVSSMKQARHHHSNCVLAGKIYVFGGYDKEKGVLLSCIESFDASQDIEMDKLA